RKVLVGLATGVVFGLALQLIYGMSAFGLARQLNIPRKEAQKEISRQKNVLPRNKFINSANADISNDKVLCVVVMLFD
ncbi:hypothetical protein Q6249_29755, partial [Klebsiella pneumoniae]|uniref:hypothetical protein n=1 Tax=Klebsiella pneumoniae TaxID=573 RepID=UPI0027309DDE